MLTVDPHRSNYFVSYIMHVIAMKYNLESFKQDGNAYHVSERAMEAYTKHAHLVLYYFTTSHASGT